MAEDRLVVLGGVEVLLRPLPTAVGIHYLEPAHDDAREQAAEELGLAATYDRRLELPGERFTVYPLGASAPPQEAVLSAAADSAVVGRATPVYTFGSITVLATDRVLFGSDDPAIVEELTRRGLVVSEVRPRLYAVTVRETEDPFAVARRIDELEGVAWAEPDLVAIGAREPTTSTTQALAVPGVGYADEIIGAPQARALVADRPAATVAVLDDGVDPSHPSLAGVVVSGRDFTGEGGPGAPNAWDFHGTACAGLIAARLGGAGVLGVASGCRLLAVRVASSPRPGAPWSTSAARLAAGIDWAADAGADVLSLSWGGSVPSSAIEASISAARARGRGGRGIVVVAAAGNVPGPLDYPALSANVLAVSGTNQFDEFKTPQSSDGETWWGSASGAQVDLAAPSVGLRTLDVAGAAGRNLTDVLTFSGTSAAAPLVAATAALVMRAAPSYSAQQVTDVLAATAARVGTQPYLDGRNDQLGWGRLDALAAVRRALEGTGSAPGRAETAEVSDRAPGGSKPGRPSTAREPGPNEVLLPAPEQPGRGPRADVPAATAREPGPNEVLLPAPEQPRRGPRADVPAATAREPGPNEVLLPLPAAGPRGAPEQNGITRPSSVRGPGPHELLLGATDRSLVLGQSAW